jgi:hypothetical protein
MTPSKSHELRTNDRPRRILLEASERIKACYPDGTKVETLIDRKRVGGEVIYVGVGLFAIHETDDPDCWHSFCPATDPHKVLP